MTESKKQIFISWSGSLSRKIAEYLHRDLFEYANLKPWISSHDIASGSAWFKETSDALNNSKFGVVCLTPGTSKKPWINFEIGWLYGKLSNCKIITFGEIVDNPLACLQRLDGCKEETWYSLLRGMILHGERSDDEIRERVHNRFPQIEELFNRANQSPYQYHCELDRQFSSIHDVMDGLKKNQFAQNNFLFQKIITKSYSDLITYSDNLQSTFAIPDSEYPKYLIHLQEEVRPQPIVKAIALIGVKEDFWRFSIGDKIKNTSHKESIRIFSFTKKEDFQAYFQILKEHARRYKVYAISYQRLFNVLGDMSRDFSIITSKDFSLVATYQDESELQNKISFISIPTTIQDYEQSYESLMKSNFIFSIDRDTDYSEDDIRNLSRKIFYGLTLYPRKAVEMSLYINVFDYNEHEEEHAYYSKMTERMITICQNDSDEKSNRSLEILEFGAGTGIFTMMLAQNLTNKLRRLDAIEFDWHCYKILNIKTREFVRSHQQIQVKVHHEDSRTYDPPGKFDYIFSTFADHHIKKHDKEIYFENVKKNLKSGGLMIVGDEFLREHTPENKEDKEQALRDYHNHIIEIAKQDGHDVLAELERQALESGLKEQGDFKVSCIQYEQFLRNAGFEFKKEKIGPPERDDIGGIYVYIAWLPSQK